MCDDYRVNDLQSSLEQATSRYQKLDAHLRMKQERCEMLERLYREMIKERYQVEDKYKELSLIGDRLIDFVVPRVACTCRRDWVCHKCQVVSDWKEMRRG